MKLEDVTALAKAGFTAQQIAAFMQLDTAQASAPAAPAPAAPAPAAPAPAAPAPAAPAPAEAPKTFNDVYNAIANMQQRIQASNLLAAQQAQPAAPTADQIIANIINPPKKEAK